MTNTQRIAEIRNELKATFKGYKFSVTKNHYSSMSIAILSAPYQMTENKYQQVNPYYIKSHFEGKVMEDLLKVKSIAFRNVTFHETGDYGTQPDFYIDITIGKWDRPFQVN